MSRMGKTFLAAIIYLAVYPLIHLIGHGFTFEGLNPVWYYSSALVYTIIIGIYYNFIERKG